MTRFSLIAAFCLVVVPFSRSLAESPKEEAKTIPLDQIWAYEMPGTKDVLQLEPKPSKNMTENELQDYFRTSSIQKILHVLSHRSSEKREELAGPAFVVVGTGQEALKNASAVLATIESKRPGDSLPTGIDLSLVFYSYESSHNVRIVSVEQSIRTVTVTYQRIRGRSMMLSQYFALVPLGKLPDGQVTVHVVELPPIDEQNHAVTIVDSSTKRVCNGYTFCVRK
jgi:hypothetical protein